MSVVSLKIVFAFSALIALDTFLFSSVSIPLGLACLSFALCLFLGSIPNQACSTSGDCAGLDKEKLLGYLDARKSFLLKGFGKHADNSFAERLVEVCFVRTKVLKGKFDL